MRSASEVPVLVRGVRGVVGAITEGALEGRGGVEGPMSWVTFGLGDLEDGALEGREVGSPTLRKDAERLADAARLSLPDAARLSLPEAPMSTLADAMSSSPGRQRPLDGVGRAAMRSLDAASPFRTCFKQCTFLSVSALISRTMCFDRRRSGGNVLSIICTEALDLKRMSLRLASGSLRIGKFSLRSHSSSGTTTDFTADTNLDT